MIRKIKKEEIPLLYPFVYRIFSDMRLPLLETVKGNRLEAIILEAMHSPRYRYGYENTWVCERENQIAGVLFGYPGDFEGFADGPLEVALVNHGYPPTKIKEGTEALPGEWLLDAIVVAPLFRNQGIAQRLLGVCENLAKEAGYSKIGVNCLTTNKIAQHIFMKAGFEEHTKILLGNKTFCHMVKTLQKEAY